MKLLEAINRFNGWRGFKVGKGTVLGDDMALRYFCMFVKNIDIENISLETCLEWLGWFVDLGFDRNTLNKKSLALKKFFEFYSNRGYPVLNYKLIPIPPKKAKLPKIASAEDYQKVIDIIPETKEYWHLRNKALLKILFDSGARIGEALSLNISDIDTINHKSDISTEKSRGMFPFRRIFWTENTNKTLVEWINRRNKEINFSANREVKDPDALFISIHGSCYKNGISHCNRMQASAVTEFVRKYSEQAGLKEPLNPHKLRHHRARDLVIKDADNSVVSSILGHSNLQSSYIYTRLYGKQLEKEFRERVGK